MQYTGSVAKGEAAPKHNRREYVPDNADKARVADNVVLVDEDLGALYERIFGGARKAYNEAQVAKGHAERQIGNYLEKVRADKQLQEVHELVVAVGDKDCHPDKDVTEAVCRAWLAAFRRRYGDNFVIAQAIIHNDEAVSHMHVEFVPVADSTRGLSRQNSLNKALAQAGHKGQHAMLGMFAEMQEMLTEAMAQQGLERVEGDKSKQMGGASMGAYKRIKAAEAQAEQLEEQVADLDAKVSLAKEGHRRTEEAAVGNPLKIASEVAKFDAEARRATEATEALAGEVARLRSQCEASERRARELEREVGSLRDLVGRAEHAIDSILDTAGTISLRISKAFEQSRVGQLVLSLLHGHSYDIGVCEYVPGGIESREIDGQLQRLREAARRQREQRQPDIQRQRPTQAR